MPAMPRPSSDALFRAGYPGVVGLPATAVPLGLGPRGLPVGAQLIGPVFAGPVCLRFAQWLERAYRAFAAPPLMQISASISAARQSAGR